MKRKNLKRGDLRKYKRNIDNVRNIGGISQIIKFWNR